MWGRRLREFFSGGARPVFIDEHAIATFVQLELMPSITRRARTHLRPDEPIGSTVGWAAGQLVMAQARRSAVIVHVSVESRKSHAAQIAVLGGKSNLTSITLYLNGALTPTDILSAARQLPLWTYQSEACIPYGLYSMLIREATRTIGRSSKK